MTTDGYDPQEHAEQIDAVRAVAREALERESDWSALAQAGLLGLGIPEEHGGDGLGVLQVERDAGPAAVEQVVGAAGQELPAGAVDPDDVGAEVGEEGGDESGAEQRALDHLESGQWLVGVVPHVGWSLSRVGWWPGVRPEA